MKYLYLWFLLTCVLPWMPFFGDKPAPREPEPEREIPAPVYLCDCGWRKLLMWHDVTVSPFTNLEPF